MSENDTISKSTIIAYLKKELDNEDMLRVDRWMSASSHNMNTFTEIRKKWLIAREEKAKENSGDPVRTRAKPARNNSGEELVPIKEPAGTQSSVIAIVAFVILVAVGTMVFFLAGVK
ncbi:MAG: hypothetical protein WDZ35_06830 [Crocinitomicaceae bacterium]